MLTQDHLKALLGYNPDTGKFLWLAPSCRKLKPGDEAGTLTKDGYIRICLEGKFYLAQRLAFLYMTGSFPQHKADHKNGAKNDNRWLNLRDVTQKINTQNLKSAHIDSSTGFLGVHPSGSKFRAQIQVDGKLKHLGLFNTPEEAHASYLQAKTKYHEGMIL